MASTVGLRALKTAARRTIFRGALEICGKGRDGRQLVFDELAALGSRPGQILYRQGPLVLVDGGDHVVWCRGDDELVGKGLIKHGQWQRDDFDAVIAHLGARGALREGAFVNVGANIGTQVLYALLGGRFTRAVAYEPEPENFATLTRNLASNGMAGRAELVQAAVSDHAGTVDMSLDAGRPGMHRVVRSSGSATLRVPAVRLDESLAGLGIAPRDIALIWIDVEGHEHAVFQGMSVFLDAKVPVLFEYSRASVSDAARDDWRRSIEQRYATIATVDRGAVRVMTFEEAFETGFTNLLVC